MKILLISDTHNATHRIGEVLSLCEPDMIIHCGDKDKDCSFIEEQMPHIPLVAVRGNNEFFCMRPYATVQEIRGHKIYITHGHKEHVKNELNTLAGKVAAQGCELALFGHTHQQTDCTKDGVRLVNPGALSGIYGSYALLEITDKDIDITFHAL